MITKIWKQICSYFIRKSPFVLILAFLVLVALAGAFMAIGMLQIAEELAIYGFYLLVIGITIKTVIFIRTNRKIPLVKRELKNRRGNSVREWTIFLIILCVFFAYAYNRFLFFMPAQIHYGDIIPFGTPLGMINRVISSWNPLNMGSAGGADLLNMVQAIYAFLPGGLITAQKAYLFLPLPIGMIGMFILLGRFVQSLPAKIFGALIYSINPMSAYGGPPGPWIEAYAWYPLIILFAIKIFEDDQKLRNVLIFSCIFAFAAFFNSQVLPLFAFPLISLFIIELFLGRRSIKHTLGSFGLILLAIPIVSVLYLPEILSTASAALNAYSTGGLAVHFLNIVGSYQWPMWLYLTSSVVSVGGWGAIYGWNTGGIVAAFGFFLPILAFASVLLLKDITKMRYALIFSWITILAIGFDWATKFGLTLPLFNLMPLLMAMYTTGPWPDVFMPLLYASLIALTVESIYTRLWCKK